MKKFSLTVACTALLAFAAPASANHSWNGYHWARTANPFGLNFDDHVSPAWDSYLATAVSDWSAKLTFTDIQGDFVPNSPVNGYLNSGLAADRKCRASAGRVKVCDASYGNNGWLGVATIWLSGGHISQGTVKLNDTYYGTGSTYDTPVWRGAVTCQESGHTLGLDHQDTSGANFHTCMDYASTPDSWNMHPNRHDFEELNIVYGSHLDSTNTSKPIPSSSGRGLHRVRDDLWVEDLGNGDKRFVFVTWSQHVPHGPPADA